MMKELEIITVFQRYAQKNTVNSLEDVVPITLKDNLKFLLDKIESGGEFGKNFKSFPIELEILVGLLTRNTRGFYTLLENGGLKGIIGGYANKKGAIKYKHLRFEDPKTGENVREIPIFRIKRFYLASSLAWFYEALEEKRHGGVSATEKYKGYDEKYTLTIIAPLINERMVLLPFRMINTYTFFLSIASLLGDGREFTEDEKNKIIEHFSRIVLKYRKEIVNYAFGYLEKIVKAVYGDENSREKLLKYLGEKRREIFDILDSLSHNRLYIQDPLMKKIDKTIMRALLGVHNYKVSKIMSKTLKYVLNKVEDVLKKEIRSPEYREFLKSKHLIYIEDTKREIGKYISKFLEGIRGELYYLVRSIEDAYVYLYRLNEKERGKILPHIDSKVRVEYELPIYPCKAIEIQREALESIKNSWGVFKTQEKNEH